MIPKVGQYWKHEGQDLIFKRTHEHESELPITEGEFYSKDIEGIHYWTSKTKCDIVILGYVPLLDILYGEESEIRR